MTLAVAISVKWKVTSVEGRRILIGFLLPGLWFLHKLLS
jgi:hypothetical protein